VGSEKLSLQLTALGYPGFAHLRAKARRNPAEVLLTALNAANLDNRVTEGLPWLALAYADMDWDWVVQNAKLLDRQNRLGFVVTLASQLASKTSEPQPFWKASGIPGCARRSRLVKEDTLCHDSLTEAERKWLRSNRPAEAPLESADRHEGGESPSCHALARHQNHGIPFWVNSIRKRLRKRTSLAARKSRTRGPNSETMDRNDRGGERRTAGRSKP